MISIYTTTRLHPWLAQVTLSIRPSPFVSIFTVLALAPWLILHPVRVQAVEIQQVVSGSGVRALLVEDYTVPIVSVSIAFAGGASQDPAGGEGSTRLLTSMLDEGAGEYDSAGFQGLLEKHGVELGFSADRDYFSGNMRTLASEREIAFRLLGLAINQPRFDPEPFSRMKEALLVSIDAARNNPEAIAARKWRETVFADHPYARAVQGTQESVSALTSDDIAHLHQRIFSRQDLWIGVVGAIDAQELAERLDTLFGRLPDNSQLETVPDAQPAFGSVTKITHDVRQTSITLALPGVKRDDPDFFAAYLAVQILGGGSFSSRLYKEVREKRGLAYGVYAYIDTYDRAAVVTASSATHPDRADEALAVMLEEIERMAREGPSEAELAAVKKYIIGSYAISSLDTSAKIAKALVTIQLLDLGVDYFTKRAELIAAVTIEDVRRVAHEIMSTDPAIVLLAPPNHD